VKRRILVIVADLGYLVSLAIVAGAHWLERKAEAA
jgi:hypothetical protein